MPKNKGPMSPSRQLKGRPVPGGKSQAGRKYTPTPGGSPTKPRVGKGRGLLADKATADVRDRTPAQQDRNAPGTYGGGFGGVARGPYNPPNAPRRG